MHSVGALLVVMVRGLNVLVVIFENSFKIPD